MYTTTNYGFNIVEGTDMVNPLTQLNPNFTSLDTDLKAVADNTVDNATCIKTGTVHAVTRVNTSAKVFRFTATGNWNTGDTMTVDGTLVSVYLPNGSAPASGCYVINTEVLAAIQGTRVTLYANSVDASTVTFDDTSVLYTANNVQTAIEYASTAAGTEYDSGVSVKAKIDDKGLCYRDMTISFDENGSYRFDNDASLIAIVGDVNKIIRAEVLNGGTGYLIAMSTYLSYKYFLLKNPANFANIPSTVVSARIYWVDTLINKN